MSHFAFNALRLPNSRARFRFRRRRRRLPGGCPQRTRVQITLSVPMLLLYAVKRAHTQQLRARGFAWSMNSRAHIFVPCASTRRARPHTHTHKHTSDVVRTHRSTQTQAPKIDCSICERTHTRPSHIQTHTHTKKRVRPRHANEHCAISWCTVCGGDSLVFVAIRGFSCVDWIHFDNWLDTFCNNIQNDDNGSSAMVFFVFKGSQCWLDTLWNTDIIKYNDIWYNKYANSGFWMLTNDHKALFCLFIFKCDVFTALESSLLF